MSDEFYEIPRTNQAWSRHFANCVNEQMGTNWKLKNQKIL